MIKYFILIQLFWINPVDRDGQDMKITHKDGRPLFFISQSHCYDHVVKNYKELKNFIKKYYKKKAKIKQILCVPKLKN